MSKTALGIMIFVLISFLQMPAVAAKGKLAGYNKNSTKKSKVARNTRSYAKAKISPSIRAKKTRSVARKTSVIKTAPISNKRTHAVTPALRGNRHGEIKGTHAVLGVSSGALAGLNSMRDPLGLSSNVALVLDGLNSNVLFEKNPDVALPIASLTKLMTALVVVEAGQDMDEVLEVTDEDIDRIKHTSSRLPIGAKLSRSDMLHIALMSSENRAASALGRNYPGGLPAFVAAMNAKAQALGMSDTHYAEPTGLSSQNVASARDLAKLVLAAYQHPLLRQYSTNSAYTVQAKRRVLHYSTTNRLIGNADWEIALQKTGYIREAGRCLLMLVNIGNRPIVMVFLDSDGPHSRFADAGRLRKWVLDNLAPEPTAHAVRAADKG